MFLSRALERIRVIESSNKANDFYIAAKVITDFVLAVKQINVVKNGG